MGLLDSIGIEGPEWADGQALTQGLLALAKNRKRPFTGLLEALATAEGVMGQAKDKDRKQQLEDEQRKQIAEERGLRMQQLQEAMAERKAAAQQGATDMGLLRGMMQPQAGPTPTGGNVAPTSFDPSAFLARGGSLGGVQNAMALNAQMQPREPTVARTVEGRDENGRPVVYQFDAQGRRIGEVVQQWKAPDKADLGGKVTYIDPVTMQLMTSFGKTNSPDALLSAETARRGQNMTDSRSREANAISGQANSKVEWKQDALGNWVALPKEVTQGQQVTPVTTTLPTKTQVGSRDALTVIDMAAPLIEKSTGSYLGAAMDEVARAFGGSTKGAIAADKLKALEGALMMKQPRMEGPQSNHDVQLYKTMAARIGDPTVPNERKAQALKEVQRLHMKYADMEPQTGGAPGDFGSVRRYNPETGRIE